MYGPPSGAILIAYVAGKPAGSIAVRPLKTLLGARTLLPCTNPDHPCGRNEKH